MPKISFPSGFPQLKLQASQDNRLWETSEECQFDIDVNNYGYTLVIPKGTVSNFASVPPIFRGLILTTRPNQAIPSFIHDCLVSEYGNYAFTMAKNSNGNSTVFTWALSSLVFDELAKQMGMKDWRRKLMVWAINLYGRFRKVI